MHLRRQILLLRLRLRLHLADLTLGQEHLELSLDVLLVVGLDVAFARQLLHQILSLHGHALNLIKRLQQCVLLSVRRLVDELGAVEELFGLLGGLGLLKALLVELDLEVL